MTAEREAFYLADESGYDKSTITEALARHVPSSDDIRFGGAAFAGLALDGMNRCAAISR